MMRRSALVGYGVGDFGINLFFMSFMTFLVIFYTDVMGLDPFTVAGVIFFARLVDAFTDPLMGVIAERTSSRWGRMRPYLLFGGVPLALISVLTFTVPDFDLQGRIIWAYVTYTLFGLIYTIVTIPYTTLTASMTADYTERIRLSSYRIGFAFAGGWIASMVTHDFVGHSVFSSKAEGYIGLMTVFGFIATVLLWVTFYTSREIVLPQDHEKPSISQSLTSVIQNPPLFIVIGIFCCGMLSFTIRMTVTPYFFTYNVGDPSLIGSFLGTTLGCMILSVPLTSMVAVKFGKAVTIRLGAYLAIVSSVGFYLTPVGSIPFIYFWGSLVAVGSTPVAVLGWAMIPDTIEYAQSKLGYRADGTISSTASFFQKLAKSMGGAGVALLLGVFGYVANQEQTVEAISAIHHILTLAPIGILIILVLLTFLYRLDKEAHGRIVEDLELQEPKSS